jgi:hypothetical protein
MAGIAWGLASVEQLRGTFDLASLSEHFNPSNKAMTFTLPQFQSLPRAVRHEIIKHDYYAIRHGERRLVKTLRNPSEYGKPIPADKLRR